MSNTATELDNSMKKTFWGLLKSCAIEIPMLQRDYPVCWVVPEDGHIAATWGKVIKIEEMN